MIGLSLLPEVFVAFDMLGEPLRLEAWVRAAAARRKTLAGDNRHIVWLLMRRIVGDPVNTRTVGRFSARVNLGQDFGERCHRAAFSARLRSPWASRHGRLAAAERKRNAKGRGNGVRPSHSDETRPG